MPCDLSCLEVEMQYPLRQPAVERTQHERGPTCPRSGCQRPYRRVLDAVRDLCVHRPYPIEKRRHGPAPHDHTRGSHDDEPIRFDPEFPGCKWARPPSDVEIRKRTSHRVRRKQGEPDPREAGTRQTREPCYLSGSKGEERIGHVLRDKLCPLNGCRNTFEMYDHAGVLLSASPACALRRKDSVVEHTFDGKVGT